MAFNLNVASEEIQDKLDELASSDDTVTTWGSREATTAAAAKREEKIPFLPGDVRCECRRCMMTMMLHAGMPQKSWFLAAQLFNKYCRRSPGQAIGSLPMVCSAIVWILVKADGRGFMRRMSGFEREESELAAVLLSLSYEDLAGAASITDAERVICERKVMEVLDWRVEEPTYESWISVFSTRLNVMTEDHLQTSFCWIWRRSLSLAGEVMLLMDIDDGAELAPQAAARALVSIAAVAAGLLPAQSLRPNWVDAKEWDRAVAQSPLAASAQPCSLDAASQALLLRVVEAATMCDMRLLQDDCKTMLDILPSLALKKQLGSPNRAEHTQL
mmetsp:Transcript_5784/g.14743  ORF Transcript_5784/g.14743 Transcript_5784/m.14743 type:complete len:330 (-) Transcript_5784:73-1062(-)